MIIISCVDDNFGLQFNNRRQSKDKKVIERIYEITKNKNLFITDFSKSLFAENKVKITENFPENTTENDCFFIENPDICDFSKVTKIILFFWNRVYPSDLKFALPKGFKVVKSICFTGNSHEKITEVEYEKD